MKRYGIWKITLVTASGEVVNCEITARSGKDAKARVKATYENCEVLKMTRVVWLDGFSYAQVSAALLNAYPNYYGHALLTILEDNGVFSDVD